MFIQTDKRANVDANEKKMYAYAYLCIHTYIHIFTNAYIHVYIKACVTKKKQ